MVIVTCFSKLQLSSRSVLGNVVIEQEKHSWADIYSNKPEANIYPRSWARDTSTMQLFFRLGTTKECEIKRLEDKTMPRHGSIWSKTF